MSLSQFGCLLLINHRIAQNPEAFNFHLAHIAVFHPEWWFARQAHTRWRTRDDHIARLHANGFAEHAHQRGNIKNQ